MYQDYLSRYFEIIKEAKCDVTKDGITLPQLKKWAKEKGKEFCVKFKDVLIKSQGNPKGGIDKYLQMFT